MQTSTNLKNLIVYSNKNTKFDKFDNLDKYLYKNTKKTSKSIIILEKKINDFLNLKGIKEINLKEEFNSKISFPSSSTTSLKTNLPSETEDSLNMNQNPLFLKRKNFSSQKILIKKQNSFGLKRKNFSSLNVLFNMNKNPLFLKRKNFSVDL